ncbi:hypothetical protein C8R44DRAFT_879160 [Mycena epipterygia]|nr:hypothetical protein C8R44DRAFT_879160 [Mycena epipterygia]
MAGSTHRCLASTAWLIFYLLGTIQRILPFCLASPPPRVGDTRPAWQCFAQQHKVGPAHAEVVAEAAKHPRRSWIAKPDARPPSAAVNAEQDEALVEEEVVGPVFPTVNAHLSAVGGRTRMLSQLEPSTMAIDCLVFPNNSNSSDSCIWMTQIAYF